MKAENHKYFAALVVMGLLVVGFIVYASKMEGTRVQIDQVTGCPKQSNGALIVLVDRTENYTEQGIRELRSRVVQEIDKLNAYDRLSIFSVSEISKRNLKPLFDKCIPDLNPDPALANKSQVNKEFKRDFIGEKNNANTNEEFKKNTVHNALSKKYNKSDESPVAQVITDLTLDTNRFSAIENKRFLIFSDMLEHTDRFSIYDGCSDQTDVVSRFKDSRTNINTRPKFNGADIIVNVLPNLETNSETLKCRAMLWNWFFSGGGANTVKWQDMPGI